MRMQGVNGAQARVTAAVLAWEGMAVRMVYRRKAMHLPVWLDAGFRSILTANRAMAFSLLGRRNDQ